MGSIGTPREFSLTSVLQLTKAQMTNYGRYAAEFCDHWLTKADGYNSALLSDAFDKFFTIFVAFNRVYYSTAVISGRSTRSDRKMATEHFPSIVGYSGLWQRLLQGGGQQDLEELRQLIGPNGIFVIHHAHDGETPDLEADARVQRGIGSGSPKPVVESVLALLYGIRCNMFHGSKAYEDRQLRLLAPSLRSLEVVTRAGLEWLRAA
jgi:hypothetical protein